MGIKDDLNRLVEKTKQGKSLSAATAPQSIRDKTGLEPVGDPAGGTGIASPLIETAYEDRTYWDDVVVTTTDGVFTETRQPIKSVKFADDNDKQLVIQYAEPVEIE